MPPLAGFNLAATLNQPLEMSYLAFSDAKICTAALKRESAGSRGEDGARLTHSLNLSLHAI